MDPISIVGQEEYIWAMRLSLNRDELQDRKQSFTSKLLLSSRSQVDTSDYQTKLMASLVPDEVITNANDYSHRKYDACFLFGDVSGFTELCEKYSKLGVSGPSKMTQVLNKYLGSMVQEVLSHSGDVLKFSGDAFLAMFKTTESTSMRDSVHEALDTSLVIQKNYGSYLTDVGVVIRVKLAISAGPVSLALIGDENNSHYVVVGKPIWEVKAAECLSTAGDIIVAPAAWHYVNTTEYIYTEVSNGLYIKLIGVGPNWRSLQKHVSTRKKSKYENFYSASIDSISDSDDYDNDDDDDDDEYTDTAARTTDEFALRPAVNVAVRMKIKEPLRKFILKPLMKSIDNDEPFEYLSEMRQAVIAVINVVSAKLENAETVILADQSYKIVCSVVDKMKGCVNKVSLFDKDLMFVVIFGLRGLKHELECQIALRCAKQCHESINKLPGVLSASIGVTTGKTYCGVFGHTLRREYTVISLTVNKAARLMVNYKGKVTCDRDTFLHSKLEARYFILQPYKPLKGISHPGPVYEYRESEFDYNAVRQINPRPLLGNQDKIRTYLKLLDECLSPRNPDGSCYKMLAIRGNARQGKTRLLDELVFITPSKIPINRVNLVEKNALKPYQCIRLLFNLVLGVTEESPVWEKEQKLLHLLRSLEIPDLLCILNDVFGVSFENSRLYLKMSDQVKELARSKLIKQLCFICFPTFCVFVIDNGEYLDFESLSLIPSILDVPTIFIVLTINREKVEYFSNSERILDDFRIKRMSLQGIDRCYLGALACHILDVYAISPELEHLIQDRSNGNPGWIESLLISLLQDQAIYIIPLSVRDVNDYGLVMPPLYEMTRLTQEEVFRWQGLLEEQNQEEGKMELTPWQILIDTCIDSYMNVTVREKLGHIASGGKIAACMISPNFHIEDEDVELSVDALILKSFDSLNFFEQLIVKCSAILGNQFFRDMMLYVMNCTDKRKAALALMKLFETRVFTCAKGDFLDSGTKAFKEKLMNPDDEIVLKCKCRGLKIDPSCRDLPVYASCGYIQFRSSLYREITYNLLTDSQKKEFHQRAIRYLEKETRKCQSCGNGYFDQILGAKHDKEFLRDRDRLRSFIRDDNMSLETVSRRDSDYSVGTNLSSGSKKKFDEKSITSMPSVGTTTASKVISDDIIFGFRIIQKLKNNVSITRTFSNDDFTDCQCPLILSSTYADLIEHCTGANDLVKGVEVMVQYAAVSINLANIPLALKTLKQALDILLERSKSEEYKWRLNLLRGKVYILIGYARMQLGHHKVALQYLHKSLNEYNIRFPTTRIRRKLKRIHNEIRQLFAVYVLPRSIMKHLDHWQSVCANNVAECMDLLFNLYMLNGDLENAQLAASWCLQKALQSFSNFQIICISLANSIHITNHLHRWNISVGLEMHALKWCHMKQSTLASDDLKCVSKLYAAIFAGRVARTEIYNAIHIGRIVVKMASSVHAVDVLHKVIPTLIYCLLSKKKFTSAFSILQEFEYFQYEDIDNSGRVWYLALCMSIQLLTGYTVLSYSACESIFEVESANWITARDPASRKRFYVSMWLWCIRNEKWEDATIWFLRNSEFAYVREIDYLTNYITAMYLLEGMIIFLVSKLDKRSIKAILKAEKEIKRLLRLLSRAARRVTYIRPKLYLMKAYYKTVKSYDADITCLMNTALKSAKKYGNDLEAGFIEHNIKAWNKSLSSISVDFWKEHSDPGNVVDFQDLEPTGGKVFYYTLPTPIYI